MTTDTRKQFNWVFLPLVIFVLYYLPVAAFELFAEVSVLMPFGKVAQSGRARFMIGRGAKRAGVLRLLTTVAVMSAFFAG